MNKFGLNARQAQVCRLEAEGCTIPEVMLAVFGIPESERGTAKWNTALKKMQAMRRLPGYGEMYQDIVRSAAYPEYGYAMKKIMSQIDDPNGWLAQNAAREVLNRTSPIIFGKEDNSVVVRFEGMPEIGVPETDDESAEVSAEE